MSQTISVGVVGPSYWSYMAAVMAQRLQKVVEAKRAESGDIPRGVYSDARRFFQLVLQEVSEDVVRKNPPASINAYVIAADAARGPHSGPPRQELKQTLRDYANLLESFGEPRQLSDTEAATAEALRKFFLRLRRAGEVESYERRVRFEQPTRRPRRLD